MGCSLKRSEKMVLRAPCGVLTCLIILTISKLLYDNWNYHYQQRGKLPWIKIVQDVT